MEKNEANLPDNNVLAEQMEKVEKSFDQLKIEIERMKVLMNYKPGSFIEDKTSSEKKQFKVDDRVYHTLLLIWQKEFGKYGVSKVNF